VVSDTGGGTSGLNFRLGTIPVSMPWSAAFGIGLVAFLWLDTFQRYATTDVEGYLLAGLFAVLFYVSILAHELAHAWVARASGNPVHGITLWGLGGYTSFERRRSTPWREGLIAAAGPALTIGLGLLLRAVVESSDSWDLRLWVLLSALAVSNIYLGIFNALPGLPLDGGAVVRCLIWGVTKDETKGTVVAAWSGRVVAVLAFLWFLRPVLGGGTVDVTGIVLGAFISAWMFSGANAALKSARVTGRIPGISARSLARRAVAVAADVPLAEALRQAQEAQATGLVVVDAVGRPTGVAQQAAVAAVPVERRPWVPVSSVAAALDPRAALPADLEGMALLRAMQDVPSAQYLVVEAGGGLVGVLSTADVESALSGTPRS
jgi:Zn-dependent protease/CBS domain-containing protein